MGDHRGLEGGVKVELAVGSVGELHGLIDVVFGGPRCKVHAAIDGEVDWHQD